MRFDMKKRRNADPLISQIEMALDLGQFISYNQSWGFVNDLEDIKSKIDDLMKSAEADRAVSLLIMKFVFFLAENILFHACRLMVSSGMIKSSFSFRPVAMT